jgi:hypothetical protein
MSKTDTKRLKYEFPYVFSQCILIEKKNLPKMHFLQPDFF